MMQLTQAIDGKPCSGQSSTGAMETGVESSVIVAATAVCEKSTKGQVKRPNRPEHVRAFEFLKVHYEEDQKADIPIQKSDVYSDYQRYCKTHKLKPLVAADFGRILKSVFPNAKDRRLGSRGCSKYCYVGVKRKTGSGGNDSSAAPCSAEDVCKACEHLVCEWASTVLSQKIYTTHELALFLLKHRYVQTRSCAALTLTASLSDPDELNEVQQQPVNKHRETQLKLQEKLKEKLLNKKNNVARTASLDDSELTLATHMDGTYSQLNSSNSTPDPDRQRQVLMHTASAPGSRRASPDHTASAGNSTCTSPVFNETVLQKALYPINYRNGFDANGLPPSTVTPPVYSQCDSAMGSERSTPIAPQYTNMQVPVQYQYDPRIQSCPTTPLPSYQQSFDFTQHMIGPTPPQCISLPGSARNTPVIPEYQDANGIGYHTEPQAGLGTLQAPQQQHNNNVMRQQSYPEQQGQFTQKFSSFQRVEFNRTDNSAFIPVKDGIETSSNDLSLSQGLYGEKAVDLNVSPPTNNDSDDLVINELLDIMQNGSSSHHPPQMDSVADGAQANNLSALSMNMDEQERSQSAQSRPAQGVCQQLPLLSAQPSQITASNSVIYSLLKSRPNHNGVSESGRFRHHSGPPLGYATPNKAGRGINTAAAVTNNRHTGAPPYDLNSPPSTPNGNFRPVHTPSRELRTFHGTEGQQLPGSSGYTIRSANSSPAAIPNRVNNSLVGTMSPPPQPLNRKRNFSGERVQSGLASGKPHMVAKPLQQPASTTTLDSSIDYMAKRNLGNRLSSPVVFTDTPVSQANNSSMN